MIISSAMPIDRISGKLLKPGELTVTLPVVEETGVDCFREW